MAQKAGRQLSPKLREKLLTYEPRQTEDTSTKEAVDQTGHAAEGAVRQVTGTARSGVSNARQAVRKRQQAIREHPPAGETTPDPPDPGPPTPQERMKRAAIEKRREQLRHPGPESTRPSAPPESPFSPTAYGEKKPINPSIHPSCPSAAPSGGRPIIREKVKGNTTPKTKPPAGASTIKTRQLVEQAAAKPPPKTVKTSAPGKAIRRKAGEKLRKQMEQQGRRELVQQAKRAAKQAADLSRKAVVAVMKAAKAMISALAGIVGGGVLLVALCIVFMVAAIVSSPLGIFFANEKTPGAVTPREAVARINTEYTDYLNTLKAGDYARVETMGHAPAWKDIMAVYACKTAGANDGVDVTAFDADRIDRLKAVFWDMVEITSTVTTEEVPAEDEENEDAESVTVRILHISITPRSAEDMAAKYDFSADQQTQLAELLAPENNPYWMSLLYGTAAADGDLVAVALSQIGNVGGAPYWSWYGFGGRVEWCACFVSWCGDQCGYLDSGVMPRFSGCEQGAAWFKSRGQWMDKNAEPAPGMIIFFDWYEQGVGQDGSPDHVGIVEKVENGRVYTIEGNSGDMCRENSYPIGYFEIYGYGFIQQ